MKLRDLTAEQAGELSEQYLKSLLDNTRKTQISQQELTCHQRAIHNGLYFYAVVENAKLDLGNPQSTFYEFAQTTINSYQPLVDECEPIVNDWLKENFISN